MMDDMAELGKVKAGLDAQDILITETAQSTGNVHMDTSSMTVPKAKPMK